jgi:hypothetical protein
VRALSHHTLLHTSTLAAQGELLKKYSALATINVVPAGKVRNVCTDAGKRRKMEQWETSRMLQSQQQDKSVQLT